MFNLHQVLKVKLKTGEIFAVDITGAQFGWYEKVMAWEDYRLRILGKGSVQPFGTTFKSAKVDASNGSLELVRQETLLEISKAAEMSIKEWLKQEKTDLGALMEMAEAEFVPLSRKIFDVVEKKLHLAVEEVRKSDRCRFYFGPDFGPALTRSAEETALLKKIWLTKEECQAEGNEFERLRPIWKTRLAFAPQRMMQDPIDLLTIKYPV
jgi:hypothetical protein